MQVYVAASFAYEDRAKTEERKALIEKTVERLKKVLPGDNTFYLPHQLKIPNAWDMSLEEWSQAVFEEDLRHLVNANLVIFLSFGKENNSGSVWEVGFHYKNMLSDIDDWHLTVTVKMTDEPESLMIVNSSRAVITVDEIESYDWDKMPNYKTSKINKIS